MIPIRDTIPSRTKPMVNYFLIIFSCYVFYLQMKAGIKNDYLVKDYAFVPKDLFFFLQGEYMSLKPVKNMFTSMFLHGGLFHLIGNMLYLFIFGDNVEDRFGHFKYLIFYIFSGFIAAFFHFLFNPVSPIPTLGASGAVAGVMGAYFIFFPKSRVLTLVPIFIFFQFVEIPAVFFLMLWFLMQLFYGSASLFTGITNIAWFAHIGGFVFGIVVAIIYNIYIAIRRY